MAFSTLRKATETDEAKLRAAWERFCDRHGDGWETGIDRAAIGCIEDIDGYGESNSRLKSQWERIACRTLGYKSVDIKHPLGIVGQYVGTSGW